MLRLFQFLAIILSSYAVSADQTNEILAVDRAFSKIAAAQGRDVAYQLYMAENPVSLEQGQNPKYGKEAILQGFLPLENGAQVTVSWVPAAGKVSESEDLAYTWGVYTYQLKHEGNISTSTGKYLSVWVKEKGDWKLATEMSNENPAP